MKASGVVAMVTVIGSACAPPEPVLAPMPGCYAVQKSAWSSEFAHATGITELPAVIGIDTDPDRYLLVPKSWRSTRGLDQVASWQDHSYDWDMVGDSVRTLFTTKTHRMAADSMRLVWRGWMGSAGAFLAATPTGFEGIMQVTSPTQTTVPRARIALTRRDCSGLQLVNSREASPVEPPDILLREPPPLR